MTLHDPSLAPTAGTGKLFARWSNLAACAAEPNIFYAPELLVPALEHLAGDADVHLVEANDHGRLIGLLPVVRRRRHGRLPIAHVVNWMHPYCFYGAPLLRRGYEEAAWQRLLAQLDSAPWASGFVHLAGMDAKGPAAAALDAVCSDERRHRIEIARYSRAMLDSRLDADAYLATHVGAQKRKQILRKQRALAEEGGVEFRPLTEAASLPGWCEDFLRLEQSGWKGASGTAFASRASHARFFRAAMDAAMAAGKLHAMQLDLNGKPIAMLVNFRDGEGSFAFKSTYDEAYRRFSPGFLLEVESLAAVQNGAVAQWMDSCTAGDNAMIDSLWAERRTIAQYRVALRGVGRRLGYMVAGTAEGFIRRIRKGGASVSHFVGALLFAFFIGEDGESGHAPRIDQFLRMTFLESL